ncbi:MAG TPA: PQQ-binding-like beta-propeller repeat protein [Candidatus Dormibacteraeota bacterium]|nr:PQQ-binding-like beta-propeller repeat protein [Candidatus Dormibacteraeota bacterium]
MALFLASPALAATPRQGAPQSANAAPTQQKPAPSRAAVVGPPERIAANALFNQHCASCHQNAKASAKAISLAGRTAPNTEVLGQMSTEAIYAALTTGVMVEQGKSLTNDQKRMIAEFFGGHPLGSAEAGEASHMTNRCASNPALAALNASPSWNGWGNGLANTHFQSAEAAGLTVEYLPLLKLKWAFGVPAGAEMSGQPSMVDGRVFFAEDNAFAYSVSAATGCVYWSYHAEAQIRTAALIAQIHQAGRAVDAVFYGDKRANVYALDARTGALLWKRNLSSRLLSHITGAPAFYDGRLYVGLAGSEELVSSDPHYPCCTYRGSLWALDANTGKVIWRTYTIPEAPQPTKKNAIGTQLWAPAGASIWDAVTIDPKQHAIYAGVGNAFTDPPAELSDSVVAFDIKTGKVLWHYQGVHNDASPGGCFARGPRGAECPKVEGPDWDYGDSPILRTLPDGKRVLVDADKGGTVVALDPDDRGKLLWKADLTAGRPGGPIQVQILWGGAADNDNVYYPLQAGAVAAVRLSDGKIMWRVPIKPSAAHPGPGDRPRSGFEAAVTVIPGILFAGGWDGVLHALSTSDGHELWQYDTAHAFTTVNGVEAHGGSLGAPGPVAAGGILLVGSGYVGTGNGMPGNVILAFTANESSNNTEAVRRRHPAPQ